jgi:DNA-binding GntR family transcriptional regulator
MIRMNQKDPARRAKGRDARSHTELTEADLEHSSTDVVINHIVSGVLAGRFVPGQRLVEADLTRALRISRGPVREAFRRLDALGILSRTMHRGACVRTLSRTEGIDLLLTTEPLIGLVARLAADEVKAGNGWSDIALLGRELRSYRDRDPDLSNDPSQRQHFYDILIAIGGNTQLPSVFPTMRIHLLRLQTQSFRDGDDRRTNVDDFAAVAEAVLAGDAKAAEKASHAHNRRMRRAIQQMPDEAFPRINEE